MANKADKSREHRILEKYPCYRDADPELQSELLGACELMEPDKGTQLMEAGQNCNVIVFVGEGSIRVFIGGESGREVTLYHVQSGEACPVNLCSAMLEMNCFAHATASKGLKVLAVPAAKLRRICEKHPNMREYIFEATVTRYGEVINLIREIATRRVDHRLVEFLLRKFEDSDQVPRVIEMTHEDIALDLGTAREVVSRRLQQLETDDAVILGRGRVILADESKLRLGLYQA